MAILKREDDFFLLTKGEYEEFKDQIPNANVSWWLADSDYNYARLVEEDGTVGSATIISKNWVRPATLVDSWMAPGTEVKLGFWKCPFTVIANDGKVALAIAKVVIGICRYDKETSCYDRSEIKRQVQNWGVFGELFLEEDARRKIGHKQDPAFLLSEAEYRELEHAIPCFSGVFPLRDPLKLPPQNKEGVNPCAKSLRNKKIFGDDITCIRPIRPAIRFADETISENGCVYRHGIPFYVVDIQRRIAVALFPLGFARFDGKFAEYDVSEIRRRILKWNKTGEF